MEIPQLDNTQLLGWCAQPEAVLLDVRTPMEWQQLGMIPGALGLPVYELPQRWQELSKHVPIAVICEHGVRSMAAVEFLHSLGFTRLANHT